MQAILDLRNGVRYYSKGLLFELIFVAMNVTIEPSYFMRAIAVIVAICGWKMPYLILYGNRILMLYYVLKTAIARLTK